MGSSVLFASLPGCSQKKLNNLNKIGHRTVARRAIISTAKEIEVGKQLAAQFDRSVEVIQDPWIERYVTALTENVVRNSDFNGSLTVRVVKSPDVDCLSLPGGFVYLTSGLLLSAESEHEIAGAIAHQVAHAATRSWAGQMTKMTILQYGAMPSTFVPPSNAQTGSQTKLTMMACPGYLPSRRDGPAIPVAFLKFQRQDELEADYLGLQYVYKAGHKPSAYVNLLQKLARAETRSQSADDIFRATPAFSQRIAQAEREIRNVLPDAHRSTKPSPEFILLKSRL